MTTLVPVEGGIESFDVDCFSDPPCDGPGVLLKDCDIFTTEMVASVVHVLKYRRRKKVGGTFCGGNVLADAVLQGASRFTNVSGIVGDGVGAGTGNPLNDASFLSGVNDILRVD